MEVIGEIAKNLMTATLTIAPVSPIFLWLFSMNCQPLHHLWPGRKAIAGDGRDFARHWLFPEPDQRPHNKTSRDMILEMDIPGVRRYRKIDLCPDGPLPHRRVAGCRASTSISHGCPDERREIVEWLAGILRVADALDCKHLDIVRKLARRNRNRQHYFISRCRRQTAGSKSNELVKKKTSWSKIRKGNQIPLLITAFLSDIHANLPALEAAVSDAKKRGVNQIYCAGDIIGYGPFPDEVCDYLQKYQIISIAGNYDEKVLKMISQGTSSIASLPKKKQKILLWTAEHLSKRSREYLTSLPGQLDLNFPGQRKVLVVHGTPLDNDDDILPSITARGLKTKMGDVRTDILVCGHTHIPFVKKIGPVLVVNCGSVGQPVDGDTRPAYAIINSGNDSSARGRIVRFEYELDRTLDALEKTSLPNSLGRDYALGSKRMFL